MAMIECKECNNRISDSAPACPQCGAPSPGGAHRLIFTRPSFVGAAVGIDVFVDGMPYGRLGVRKKIEIPVSPGSHHVEIINTRGSSNVASISTTSGDTAIRVGTWGLRPSINME